MKTTIIVDGDLFAYKAAGHPSAQFKADMGHGMISVVDPDLACRIFDDTVARFKKKCRADEIVVCLSCDSRRYWRHTVWPAYKQHRRGGERPEALDAVRAYVKKEYRTFQIETLEADDVLGVLGTSDKSIKGEKILISVDKDLRQIPGKLFNPNGGTIEEISQEQADWFHLYQTLCGDVTDNYPGCPGIGDVKARKLLATGGWPVVLKAFVKAGKTEEEALVQARVSRILRAGEWDKTHRKVNLWCPILKK
jgi:5'-3' exonuclease